MRRVFLIVMLGLTMLVWGVYGAGAEMSQDRDTAAAADSQLQDDDSCMPMTGRGMMNCGMMGGGMGMSGRMGYGMRDGCMGCGMMGRGVMGRGMMGGCDGCMGCGMMGRGMMGPGMMGHMMMDHQGMMRGLMNLGLNDKQKEEMFEIRDRNMKEIIRKRADKQIAMVELGELLAKEPMDMKALEAKMKQIESLRADIFMSFIKAREDMKSKLTPDQLRKLRGVSEDRCGMMGEGPGGMMQEMPEMQGHEGMENN